MKKMRMTACLALGLSILVSACADATAQGSDKSPTPAPAASRTFRGAGFTVDLPQAWDATTVRESMSAMAPRGKMLITKGGAWMERGIFAYSYTLAGDTANRSLIDLTAALAPRLLRSGDIVIGQPKLVELAGRSWGLFIVKQLPQEGESKPSIAFHFVQKQDAVVVVLVAGVYGDSSMEGAAAIQAEPDRAFDRVIASLRIDRGGPAPIALTLAAPTVPRASAGGTINFNGQLSPNTQLYMNAIEAARDAVRYAPYTRVP